MARNSPPVEITPTFSIGTRELLAMIRKIANEVYEHEKTRKGAGEIGTAVEQAPKKGGTGSTTEPIDISGKGMPALARYMRQREQPRLGTQRIFKVGSARDQDLLVREQLMPFQKAKGTEVFSRAFEKEGGGFGKVPVGKHLEEVAPALESMGSPERVAGVIRTIARGETPAVRGKFAENVPHLAAVAATMFGAEGGRSSSAFVSGMMATELMAKGMSPEKALRLMPMAPERATQAARDVKEYAAGRRDLESLDPNARRMVETETKLVQEWVKRVVELHEVDDKESLERLIRKHVEKFFALNPTSRKKGKER